MEVNKERICLELGVAIIVSVIVRIEGSEGDTDRRRKSKGEYWKFLIIIIGTFYYILSICKHKANYLAYIFVFTLIKALGPTHTTSPTSQIAASM